MICQICPLSDVVSPSSYWTSSCSDITFVIFDIKMACVSLLVQGTVQHMHFSVLQKMIKLLCIVFCFCRHLSILFNCLRSWLSAFVCSTTVYCYTYSAIITTRAVSEFGYGSNLFFFSDSDLGQSAVTDSLSRLIFLKYNSKLIKDS